MIWIKRNKSFLVFYELTKQRTFHIFISTFAVSKRSDTQHAIKWFWFWGWAIKCTDGQHCHLYWDNDRPSFLFLQWVHDCEPVLTANERTDQVNNDQWDDNIRLSSKKRSDAEQGKVQKVDRRVMIIKHLLYWASWRSGNSDFFSVS